LYRIRRVGRDDLDYIGQTGAGGMTLKKRMGMLRGIYAEVMPYRDPHTAGPALWALRHMSGCEFEVSVAEVAGETPWRKGLEAVAISAYRQERGASPTVNFGRMPKGYRMSSANNAKKAKAGQVFRGGPCVDVLDCHHLSIAPLAPLDGEPSGADWCGHRWSPWVRMGEAGSRAPASAAGLYRVRVPDAGKLLYIGQGVIAKRLRAHRRKIGVVDERQGPIFGATEALDISWVVNDRWLPHQRLELENDLIAAHVLTVGSPPAAQFLG
jgi:hypothetical protein